MKTYLLKALLSLSFVTLCLAGLGQHKFQVAASTVSFFSTTPLEDIEANNTKSKGIIDFGSNSFLIKIPVKSFDFASDLMEEHFNENYMETDKFPDAIFRGKIQGNYNLSKDGIYTVVAAGDLTIHGVVQKRTVPCYLTVNKGSVKIRSEFDIKLADHNIEIPNLVFQKIAEVVKAKIDMELSKI